MLQSGERDFDFLKSEDFEIGECLKFQGWEYLCYDIDLPTYPNLVRKFYTNVIVSLRSSKTKVKGVRINLIQKRLGVLLHAPTEDAKKIDDKAAGLRFFFRRDDTMHFEEIHARDLSIEYRLLHHMTARILLPQLGRFDFLIKNDIAIMYHTLRREKFNLPALFLKVMQEASQRKKPALLHRMFLTLIFQDFGVNLEGESTQKLQHYDTYNLKSMKRIKFKKIEGQWFKTDEGKERDVPKLVPQHPMPATSSSTIRFAEDQIEEIVQQISDQVFDCISGCLSSLMENTVRRVFAE